MTRFQRGVHYVCGVLVFLGGLALIAASWAAAVRIELALIFTALLMIVNLLYPYEEKK